MRCSADQVSLNIEGIERVSASSRLTKSTVVKKRPRELARERGSAARCHYLQAKLANGTKPSREDRDRKNPVTTDQMSWSNSTEREDINRFDPARQPDRFYGRDRHAQSSRAEVSDEYESFRRMG
jgi:hypothetical protein